MHTIMFTDLLPNNWSQKWIQIVLWSKLISEVVPNGFILINCSDCKICSGEGKLKRPEICLPSCFNCFALLSKRGCYYRAFFVFHLLLWHIFLLCSKTKKTKKSCFGWLFLEQDLAVKFCCCCSVFVQLYFSWVPQGKWLLVPLCCWGDAQFITQKTISSHQNMYKR